MKRAREWVGREKARGRPSVVSNPWGKNIRKQLSHEQPMMKWAIQKEKKRGYIEKKKMVKVMDRGK
jgi:hypothetical protein